MRSVLLREDSAILPHLVEAGFSGGGVKYQYSPNSVPLTKASHISNLMQCGSDHTRAWTAGGKFTRAISVTVYSSGKIHSIIWAKWINFVGKYNLLNLSQENIFKNCRQITIKKENLRQLSISYSLTHQIRRPRWFSQMVSYMVRKQSKSCYLVGIQRNSAKFSRKIYLYCYTKCSRT